MRDDLPPRGPPRRLVLATATAFYPPFRGDAARLFQLLSSFRRRGWRLVVVHCHSDEQTYADYDEMARRVDRLVVHRPALQPAGRPEDDSEDVWCPDAFAELVADVAREERADVVVAHFAFLSKCLAALRGPNAPLKVLDADNVFTGRRELFESAGFSYDWVSLTEEAEIRALARADVLLAIQEDEQRVLRRLAPEKPVVLVPHAHPIVDARRWDTNEIFFVGNRSPVNEHGLREFAARSLPIVRRHHPDARLVVAGKVSEIAEGLPGVVPVGRPLEIEPYYRAASVVINPGTAGTGLKIKTVEALCHGKCLVTTPVGAEGLERYEGIYHIARDWQAFGEIIAKLFAERAAIQATGDRAMAFAARYFDPDRVFGRLERALVEQISRRARVGRGATEVRT